LKLSIVLLILIVAINLQFANAETKFVSIPQGTSVQGRCEIDNMCYDPFEVTIMQGDSIKWTNDDTAAHTVTSGNNQMGHDGIFESSLILAGRMYTEIFDSEPPGDYTYFCLVHPWMTGIVHVLPRITVGGEMIPVETTVLFLAGTQNIAAWFIPVIVSAIGIGIVIARKF